MTQQSHHQAYTLRKPKLKDTCTPMLAAALFTIARTWKQHRYPLTDEWIKKLWYIYTMEYYSAIKWNAFESVLMRWMNLEPIIQGEVSQKEKDKYILMHIQGFPCSSVGKESACLFMSFPHLLIGLFVFLVLSCVSCLYILEINPLPVVSFSPILRAVFSGLIPGLERSSGEGNGYPLQYPCLENHTDRGAWWAIVHGFRVGHD